MEEANCVDNLMGNNSREDAARVYQLGGSNVAPHLVYPRMTNILDKT